MAQAIRQVSIWQHLLVACFIVGGAAVAFHDYMTRPRYATAFPEQVPAVVSTVDTLSSEPIVPIPQTLDVDPRKVALGERLYHDERLSKDKQISCASCHDLTKGGTDRARYSIGVDQSVGIINAPTTFNSVFNFAQFWDGRAETLQAQAPGPIHNPIEMGSNWPEIVAELERDADYVSAFNVIYHDGITGDNLVDAIVSFEMSLITPNSRFDQYLLGDRTAISDEEQQGYLLFKSLGCVACHQGVNLGGNLYQTMGVMDSYFSHRPVTAVDLGRYNVTGQSWNKFQFKVPTLRNIALTYPYLHDGSAKTLREVLSIMAESQLGRTLEPEQVHLIVKFLHTLTGTYKGNPL